MNISRFIYITMESRESSVQTRRQDGVLFRSTLDEGLSGEVEEKVRQQTLKLSVPADATNTYDVTQPPRNRNVAGEV